MADWTEVAQSLYLGAFPWISQFRRLDFHFQRPGLDLKSIDNFFASLFAIGIAAYGNWAPAEQLLDLPRWYWLFSAALVLTIAFFTLYLYERERVSANHSRVRWPIVANFILYVLVFCFLAAGFAALGVYQDYVVVRGEVVDQGTGKPIAGAAIDLTPPGGSPRHSGQSASNGRFEIAVPQGKEYKDIDEATITAEGYEDRTITVGGGINAHVLLRRVSLRMATP